MHAKGAPTIASVCAVQGYNPSVPLEFVTVNLGFDSDDECAFFIQDHGVSFVSDDRQQIDCKTSRTNLVEHSIQAKLEEERKEAQRKAEIVPISFS